MAYGNRIAILTPGSSSAAIQAGQLFGFDRVEAGAWLTPVRIFWLTNEEFDFAVEYFKEQDIEVQEGW